MEELKFPFIKGVQCRVLPYNFKFAKVQSKNDSASGSSDEKATYVFVKGFFKAKWTHEDLYKAFSTFGVILSAKVSIDKLHVSKGFGYI